MKKITILLIVCIHFSCTSLLDQAVENAIPEPETLEIAVKNSSSKLFTRIEITTPSGLKHVYHQTEPGFYSNFLSSNYVYNEVEIIIQTKTGYYSFAPLNYDETSKVTKGTYYFDVSILDANNLSVIRKKL